MTTEHRGRIYWKSTITGATGHGSAILDFAAAKTFMDEGNREFPELNHWFMPIWGVEQ